MAALPKDIREFRENICREDDGEGSHPQDDSPAGTGSSLSQLAQITFSTCSKSTFQKHCHHSSSSSKSSSTDPQELRGSVREDADTVITPSAQQPSCPDDAAEHGSSRIQSSKEASAREMSSITNTPPYSQGSLAMATPLPLGTPVVNDGHDNGFIYPQSMDLAAIFPVDENMVDMVDSQYINMDQLDGIFELEDWP